MTGRVPAKAIWALGATQIIGYGSLYYSFSVVAPHVGQSFGWSPEWVFGALTIALLAGGFVSPLSGHLIDRLGAFRTMAAGSLAAGGSLLLASLAPSGYWFAAALLLMEVTSTLVLYAAAFAALVQIAGHGAQRSITHLTLIAGFASTIFWPFTAALLSWMDWRAVYLLFAALNVLVCAPLHSWLGGLPKVDFANEQLEVKAGPRGELPPHKRSLGYALVLAGFAIEGFVMSAVLLQIAPLLSTLGLAASMGLITTVFGPAQVLSRLINMVFGRDISAVTLAVFASILLPAGTLLLVLTTPSLAGAILFALLFGLGSGLTSIVSGSLPLQLFGRDRYGARLGWLSSARQVASAVAPFALAVLIGSIGVVPALEVLVAIGAFSILIFGITGLLTSNAADPVRLST